MDSTRDGLTEADQADVRDQTRELVDDGPEGDIPERDDAVGTRTEAEQADVLEQAVEVPEEDEIREE